jgi:hypothetical protein
MRNLIAKFFELITKIGTQRRYQVAFGLWVGGPAMIFVSLLLENYEIGSKLIQIFILECGIACLIAAIADFILLEHAIKIFREEVRQDMRIVSHCLEHQLVDVMSSHNQEQEDLTIQEINLAIENARGDICISVFTLRDILNYRTSLESPLRHLLNSDKDVKVKLLLIDPTSVAAQIRVMAEEGEETLFEKSNLHAALRSNFYAIRELINIAKNKNRFKIEALFYDILPNFFMVSTPSEVFIEPYHLGYKTGGGSTIGGLVPLLRFGSKSPMYEFAKSHFSYIWKNYENGYPTDNGARHNKGYIRVKTMDEVSREIDKRLGRSERRSKTLPVDIERRSPSNRRGTTTTTAS